MKNKSERTLEESFIYVLKLNSYNMFTFDQKISRTTFTYSSVAISEKKKLGTVSSFSFALVAKKKKELTCFLYILSLALRPY